jgi:hypothetical protein
MLSLEKNLVHRDVSLIESTNENFIRCLPLYQNVIDQFSDLKIGNIATNDEFQSAISNPEAFLLSKMTEHLKNSDQPLFGGFRLQPEKLIELLDAKDKSEFIEAAKACKYEIGFFVNLGTINRKGKVEISKNKLDEFIKRNEVWAVTEKEIAVFEAFKGFRNAMQLLFDAGGTPFGEWQMNMNVFLEKPVNQKHFRLNVHNFKALTAAR